MAKKKMGRPPKPKSEQKGRYLQVRVDDAEKAAFDRAARLSGIDLSAWVRERLRGVARKEIMAVGEKAAFDLDY
jgi:predicted HicB family RNase H-like nuclease